VAELMGAAGLLLALKEGTRKGRQEGEVLSRERCKLLFSSFGAGENHLEQFLEGLSACVLECAGWLLH
jgi:hypothetical protein